MGRQCSLAALFDVVTGFVTGVRSHSVWDKVVWFLGWKQKNKELFRKMCECESFSSSPEFQMLPPGPHSHAHLRKRLHLCFLHFSNWRQPELCIALGTTINNSLLDFERHYQYLHCFPPCKHAHTQMHAQGTQWLLFIVHSFMRASCLPWYSFILHPTLSFPAIPWGTCPPKTHNSDCVIQWLHSSQRYCCSETHVSPPLSPAETELISFWMKSKITSSEILRWKLNSQKTLKFQKQIPSFIQDLFQMLGSILCKEQVEQEKMNILLFSDWQKNIY